MGDFQKVSLVTYIITMILTAIPSIKLLCGIYITKKYKNVFDKDFFSWMSFVFFFTANTILLGRFIYLLL